MAILGASDFDVHQVDAATLAFGPAGASPAFLFCHTGEWLPFFLRILCEATPFFADVNHDGFADRLSYYKSKETGIQFGDTEACLTGATLDGARFEGCDAVATLPGCGHGYEAVLVVPAIVYLRRLRRRQGPGGITGRNPPDTRG